MSLDDAQIERYGRQILLPEVGGRGQERLLQSAVAVVGEGVAADFAALLLGRAGVGRLELVGAKAPSATPDCTVVPRQSVEALGEVAVAVWIGVVPPVAWCGVAVWAGGSPDGSIVLALPGRPCAQCLAPPPSLSVDGSDARAIGALAAAETLRLMLTPGAPARRSCLCSDGPALTPIEATLPCPACPTPP